MAHRVWATGEPTPTTFQAGSDSGNQAYIEVTEPTLVSTGGGTVRYASGLDSATSASPVLSHKVFGAGTWSFLADSGEVTVAIG